MNQLSMLPEIDRGETKEAVEGAFEKYRFYLLTVPEEKHPKITPTYSLIPPTFTNQFHSATEDAVIDKVDYERERDDYIEKIRRAVNRLGFKERELIVKRYLSEEDMYDYEVYNDLGLSESKFYKMRGRAFYKLAFILRIEIYKTDEKKQIFNRI